MNDVRVAQAGAGQYVIHQYKDFVGAQTSCDLGWQGQTDLAPSTSAVVLQIYNRNSALWETVASNSSVAANTDFDMAFTVADLANYKDAGGVIASRIYQLGV